MSTGRRRWWRAAAVAAVGGGVAAGGWFGFVRAKADPAQPAVNQPVEDGAWTRSAAPSGPSTPMVAEVTRTPAEAPPVAPGAVTPASAALPIPPVPGGSAPVVPAIPAVPVAPVAPPAAPLPLPALPVEPVSGPRAPDAGLAKPGDNAGLPAVPPVPPVELPAVPAPKAPDVKAPEANPIVPPAPTLPPGVPSTLPPIPATTTEPPKALPVPTSPMPAAPAAPTVAPAVPVVPPMPVIPQPADIAPSVPPAKPVEPAQPAPPISDSRLNTPNPGNTLNSTEPPVAPTQPVLPLPLPAPTPVAPAVPVVPGGAEVPGTAVGRPKPAEPSFGASDKFVFPIPGVPDTTALTPRDDAMLNLKHTAALAVLGGALFTAEQSRASALPPIPPVLPPGTVAAAQNKADPKQLKKDLDKANETIEKLEKQVKALTELLTGKKDDLGFVLPSDPGAVEEIKRLKNTIAEMDKELKALRTQTALRPAVVPEAKPKGIVRVVNEYPIEISIVVNEKSYRVAPQTKIEVEVPAGEFTYQLLQSGAAATRSSIKDKETVTLRIK
jgi:hypothetical protein